jgi:glutaminase
MSVAKPFVYALLCAVLGRETLRRLIGLNATGLRFNSVAAVEQSADGRTNPMVNPGAIAVTSLVPGADAEQKWDFVRDGLAGFAGRRLALNDEVYASASETNHRNRSLARDLSMMAATLANGGVNPLMHERVVDAESCHGTFAPLLDEAGNSVKGQLAAAFLSRRLGLDVFASRPGG